MSARVFIDTNIFVYAHTNQNLVKQELAQDIILRNETWISTQVLQELSSTLFKKFNTSCSDIEQVLLNIGQANGIHLNTPATILEACKLAAFYGYSFYDSLILSAAIECGCPIVYSEDMSNGQVIAGKLTIVNPFV